MTIVLDLDPDIEARLQARAARKGQDLQKYVQEVVTRDAEQEPTRGEDDTIAPGQSLAEALKDYIGVVQGSQEPWSENCGERFTDYLVEKQRQGHL